MIVPRGVEHRPVADEERSAAFRTSNNAEYRERAGQFTVPKLDWL